MILKKAQKRVPKTTKVETENLTFWFGFRKYSSYEEKITESSNRRKSRNSLKYKNFAGSTRVYARSLQTYLAN